MKKQTNIGMIGAVIGTTIALSLLNKKGKEKITQTLDNTVKDLKNHALDAWDELKTKVDLFLKEIPPTNQK